MSSYTIGGITIRGAIYCRLPREDYDKLHENDESESIQNQKSMLINYAMKEAWDIYNIYCDEDYSGIDSERPEFNRLLEDAKSHKFDIVLCKTQSRFTRDMELALHILLAMKILKNLVTEKIRDKILAFYDFDNFCDDLFVSNDNLNRAKLLENKKETLS